MKKEELRTWRKSTEFFCPQCQEEVLLKVGDIMIPHFSHKSNTSCSASFSEGESEQHLLGKAHLYHLLNQVTEKVELEPYFKEIAQRPDLLVEKANRLYPIEFQCSVISIPQIQKRTMGFINANMKPIWILHTPEKLKKIPQGVQKIHFSKFEEQFFTNISPEGLVLLTYDPQHQSFHYFSTLQHVLGRQYIGVHRTLPIAKQTFPFARPKFPTSSDTQVYFRIFKQMRQAFLHGVIFRNRRGINHPFLRKCYELRTNARDLPNWIGVPIPFQNPFVEHPCEWQLAFIYYIKREQKSVQFMCKKEIKNFLKTFDRPYERLIDACMSYRGFLLSIGINSWDKTINIKEEKIVASLLAHSLQSDVKIEKM